MLHNIKHYIRYKLPCISFEEYYVNYVSQIQDMNISCELDYLMKHNTMNPLLFDQLIETACRGIVQ